MYEAMVFMTLGILSEMTVNQHWKKKSGQHRILYPAKFPFKNEEEIKSSSNLQKVNSFIIITHTVRAIKGD